jgi:Flp pilus assembly protein TadG
MTRARLRQFVQAEDGAAAIEFALIAPVVLLLFIGMANLGIRAFEEARINQVTRETAEAALFTQNLTALATTLDAAISDLGDPISGTAYTGAVTLLCICPGQTELVGCSSAQAALCPATGLPWEIVIEVSAALDYRPLLPGFGEETALNSVLRVQAR